MESKNKTNQQKQSKFIHLRKQIGGGQMQGMEVGNMGEGDQRYKTSGYKINMSCKCNGHYGDSS